MKKLPQGSNKTVMLTWCLKQIKDIIRKFSIKGSFFWGAQNYYMHYIQYCFVFIIISGRAVDDLLVKLSLIEQIIKNPSLMGISFGVKHPQTFRELWMNEFVQYVLVSFRFFFNCSKSIYLNYKLFSSSLVFVCWSPFATNFKWSNLQSHLTIFKWIKLHQMLSVFSTINLAYILESNIFGRDYWNFNNLFQRY